MKPNKLDSKFSLGKHVIIETKARDTFSLVNVDKGTTLIRNAKYLKHAPGETIDDAGEVEISITIRSPTILVTLVLRFLTFVRTLNLLVMLTSKPLRMKRSSPPGQIGDRPLALFLYLCVNFQKCVGVAF